MLNVSWMMGQWFPISGGWIDANGSEHQFKADTCYHSVDGYARFEQEGKVGFVKISDPNFTSGRYNALTDFNGGYAMAKLEDTWWVLDSTEKKIKKVSCHFAYAFSEGLARIQLGNRFGFVNTKGEIVIPVKYFGAHDFSEGRARVYLNDQWGVIDKAGKWVVKPSYDYIWDYKEGLACVLKKSGTKKQWGFINQEGKVAIDLQYDYVFPFSSGMAIVRKGDYFMNDLKLINPKGEVVYEIPYKDMFPFSEGLACFFENGKWGYVNTSFEVVIAAQFDHPRDFKDGMAWVHREGTPMYINKEGVTVWQ